MDAVSAGTLTDGGMMEAEARCASLRILGVQVEVSQLTPEWKKTTFNLKAIKLAWWH